MRKQVDPGERSKGQLNIKTTSAIPYNQCKEIGKTGKWLSEIRSAKKELVIKEIANRNSVYEKELIFQEKSTKEKFNYLNQSGASDYLDQSGASDFLD